MNEGYSDWSIPVVYSGASDTNNNDYVSVILADSSNKALYYENIANKSKASSAAGQEAKAPAAPKRAGYTFTGWDKDFSRVTSDMTVTAQWKKKASTAVSGTLISRMTAKGKNQPCAHLDQSEWCERL